VKMSRTAITISLSVVVILLLGLFTMLSPVGLVEGAYDPPPIWRGIVWLLVGCLVGAGLYRLRQHPEGQYYCGLSYVLAAVATLWLALYSPIFIFRQDNTPNALVNTFKFVMYLTAIYIFVRGLNNMHKGLRAGPWQNQWNRIFSWRLPPPGSGPDDLTALFPSSEAHREAFRKELEVHRKQPWIIADNRYQGTYGPFEGASQYQSWRSREALRYITEEYRQRELRLVRYTIYAAIGVGVVAVGAAVLAMPMKDSVLSSVACRTVGMLCDPTSTH
jgi:hypothetical protein